MPPVKVLTSLGSGFGCTASGSGTAASGSEATESSSEESESVLLAVAYRFGRFGASEFGSYG